MPPLPGPRSGRALVATTWQSQDYTTGMVEKMLARVRDYMRAHDMIQPGDTIVVAVSGGADSLCLLHVLHALAPELECHLHVAHLDHMLRQASAADAAFVQEQATRLSLACTVSRHDVRARAMADRQSLETAARAARFEFLRATARATRATSIATGHTRDDQAETLLLHVARGSGLAGLAAMRARADGVIRPLLDVGRHDTVTYCREVGLVPREDETNRSPAHRRNRIRHDVLPRLDAIQPAATANIARAARLIAGDLALLERLATRSLDETVVRAGQLEVTISVARWQQSEPELRPHMLRLLVTRLLGSAAGFEERHYGTMLQLLAWETADAGVCLPHGLSLSRRRDVVMLGVNRASRAPIVARRLTVPGRVVTEAGVVTAEVTVAPDTWTRVRPEETYISRDLTGPTLTVRGWLPGDRVRPLGMAGTRKVQDIFVDRKIPRARRQGVPIVVGPSGIAWVAGLTTGDGYRVAPRASAVRLLWEPDEGPEGGRDA